jgi:anaerobic magnesium-protoporphyrin IX monomethyl ester cyclase
LVGALAKYFLGPDVVIIHGGVHASALPEESLVDSMCDIVVVDEGELTLGEICQGKQLKEILGVVFREDTKRNSCFLMVDGQEIVSRLEGGELAYNLQKDLVVELGQPVIIKNQPRPYMKTSELDSLPFPDIDLYDFGKYHNPHIIARKHPLMIYETSRDCPYTCDFCSSKGKYRVISSERVIETMKYFKSRGIKEIRITDNQFLANVNRGKEIMREMVRANLGLAGNLGNGVRADRCDAEFVNLAKRAGFYQIGVGFEAGDQESLDSVNKKLDLEAGFQCAKLIKGAGIELVGFFMIGTPGDTRRTMQKTIDLAKKIMPDLAKVTICIPFPDTRLFALYNSAGLITSRKWDDYNIHKSAGIFRHPNPDLTPEVLTEYYEKFYREFYLNPRYLLWAGLKSIGDGSIFRKTYYGVKTFFPKLISGDPIKNLSR